MNRQKGTEWNYWNCDSQELSSHSIINNHFHILIIVQKDTTIFSLLYFCRQLYMFRVLTPIIRSSYSCNYSFWHWSTGPTIIRSRWVSNLQLYELPRYNRSRCWLGNSTTRADGSRPGWPVPEAVITVVRAPDDGCQHPKHVQLPTEI